MSRIVVSAAIGLCSLWLSLGAAVAPAAEDASTRLEASSNVALSNEAAEAEAGEALDRPLALLGIAAHDGAEQGDALGWALRRALDSSIEWSCPSLRFSFGNLMSSMGCPETPDADCLARIGKKVNLDRFVWGKLKVTKGHVTANLGLFDGADASRTVKLEYSAKMTDTFDEDLLRLASSALGDLLGPLHFPVIVRSRERTGEVFVDEVSVGKLTEGVVRLSATVGDHRLRLVLPDATAIARSFQVRVEHTTLVRLDFIDVPET
jgi:hypothetical protein